MLIGSCLFVIIMLVLIAVVVLLLTKRGTNKTKFDRDGNPTKDDGAAPTEAPTLSNDTKNAVRDFLELLGTQYKGGNDQVADMIFSDTSAPQYKAIDWAWESALEEGIDMQSDRMIQRFALATFYFATNGDEWVRCGRKSTRCDVTQEWLTGADECDWYAIECDEEGDVTEIYFRKFLSTENPNADSWIHTKHRSQLFSRLQHRMVNPPTTYEGLCPTNYLSCPNFPSL